MEEEGVFWDNQFWRTGPKIFLEAHWRQYMLILRGAQVEKTHYLSKNTCYAGFFKQFACVAEILVEIGS